MYRAVLDTNVLVSGLLTMTGNPAQIINLFKARRFALFYCAEILAEYRDVLYRDKLGLKRKDVNDLLELIREIGFPVVPEISSVPLTDESDRTFYDVAKSSGSYLVTGNIRHFPPEPFIIKPIGFLVLLAKVPEPPG